MIIIGKLIALCELKPVVRLVSVCSLEKRQDESAVTNVAQVVLCTIKRVHSIIFRTKCHPLNRES